MIHADIGGKCLRRQSLPYVMTSLSHQSFVLSLCHDDHAFFGLAGANGDLSSTAQYNFDCTS